jgi:hypothetical protein
MGWLGMPEVLFFQAKSDGGNLKITQGHIQTTGVLIAVTPASLKTFVLYQARISPNISGTNSQIIAQLRNNGMVQDNMLLNNTGTPNNVIVANNMYFLIKGDTLIGDGTKTYDIFLSVNSTPDLVYGTIEGYIE